MSRKLLWLGHAPDIPQIGRLQYDEDVVLTEGADLTFKCNGKTIVVEAPDEIEDLLENELSDSGGVKALLQVAEAAINGSTIPEFRELTASVIPFDTVTGKSYYALDIQGPDGVPFTLTITSGKPNIDIDIRREGTPGVNEFQSIAFLSVLTAGEWFINWNFYGSGTGTGTGTGQDFNNRSLAIPFVFTAEDVKTALIGGIDIFEEEDIEVTGSGNETSPLIIELKGAWAETNVDLLSVDVTSLVTATQEAFTVEEVITGGEGVSDYIYYLAIPTWASTNDRTEVKIGDGDWITVNHYDEDANGGLGGYVEFIDSLALHPSIGADNYEFLSYAPRSQTLIQPNEAGNDHVYYNPADQSLLFFKLKNELSGLDVQVRMYSAAYGQTLEATVVNPKFEEVYWYFPPDYESAGGGGDSTPNTDMGELTLSWDTFSATQTTPWGWIIDPYFTLFGMTDGMGDYPFRENTGGYSQKMRTTPYQGWFWYNGDETSSGTTFVGGLVIINSDTNPATNLSPSILSSTHESSATYAEAIDGSSDAYNNGVWMKIQDAGSSSTSNDVQSIWTAATEGLFSIIYTNGSSTLQTTLMNIGSTASIVEQRINDVLGVDYVSVSGLGTEINPYIIRFNGPYSIGIDHELLQVSGVGILIETVQDGSPPLGDIWGIYVEDDATGGDIAFTFQGRKTPYFDYTVEDDGDTFKAALEAMSPGNFVGSFTLSGNGTFEDPWILENVDQDYLGVHYVLRGENDQLEGPNTAFTYTPEYQVPTGKHWIDNPINWRNIATQETETLPVDGDEIFLEVGSANNSIKYGDISDVLLWRFHHDNLFSGEMGLPEINQNGYVEYRNREITLNFGDHDQSFEDPNIVIGKGQGSSSGLMRLNTESSEVHIRVERTAGPTEAGRPAFNWRGVLAGTGTIDDYLNTLQVIDGSVGVAMFAGTQAELKKIFQRGGNVRLANGCKIGLGGYDRIGGESSGRYRIGSDLVPVILGG